NLWTQFGAWRVLRDKTARLQQALNEAIADASSLTQKHDALEKQVKPAEEQTKQAKGPQASNQKDSRDGRRSDDANSTATSAAISSLHQLSVDQKDLVDLNK